MRKSLLFKINTIFATLATANVGAHLAECYSLRDDLFLLLTIFFVLEAVTLATVWVLAIRRCRCRSRHRAGQLAAGRWPHLLIEAMRWLRRMLRLGPRPT